jgi:hypothetical protein
VTRSAEPQQQQQQLMWLLQRGARPHPHLWLQQRHSQLLLLQALQLLIGCCLLGSVQLLLG